MTTWPAASTPCTWKTDFAMSRPIVVIVCMDAPPNRGSLNSAHIHGTHVPVEEPSTASEPAVSNRSKEASLVDHLVGAGEQRRRHGEAERPGASSNLLACPTGRSAGFAPLRMWPA